MTSEIPPYEAVNRSAVMFVKSQNKKDLICAEIGVFQGENAENILSVLDVQKIFLVDSFSETGPNATYGENARNTSLFRLKNFNDKITWHYLTSVDAAEFFPYDLDFCYIDSDHRYSFIVRDLELYWPKIKKGGVLGGHDYYTTAIGSGVKEAVDEFCLKNKLELHTGGWDWWIVKN